MKDVAQVVTDELLLVRQKVQDLVTEETQPPSDAHDAYVSALIGHLFAILLTGFEPGRAGIDRTPDAVGRALDVIARKVSAVAGSLDPASEYRVEILRREKSRGA